MPDIHVAMETLYFVLCDDPAFYGVETAHDAKAKPVGLVVLVKGGRTLERAVDTWRGFSVEVRRAGKMAS